MTPGQFARSILGPAFPIVGAVYRRLFVDMHRVVDAILPDIGHASRILDVGGGDGYVVDLILDRLPGLSVTMMDLAPTIGTFIKSQNRNRVTLMPATDVTKADGRFDAILLTDVVHHVPPEHRESFFADLSATAERCYCDRIIIKDIRPGNLRALLALWGDLYITGDRGVRQTRESDLHVPRFKVTGTSMPDFPNYVVVFQRA